MSYHEISGARVPIKAWTNGVPVEEAAQKQLRNVASLPFVFPHVAAMPDVHWGLGATVGSVIPTRTAIIPAAVGVDIGCGMCAVRLAGLTPSDLPDNLARIRAEIERAVPVGLAQHREAEPGLAVLGDSVHDLLAWLRERHPKIGERRKDRLDTIICSQLGTLGGGNHFIELCLDDKDGVWLMLHSGSRGIGNLIGQYFIEAAKKDCEQFSIELPDRNLAYLQEGTVLFDDYVYAVDWCQRYAARNREDMVRRVLIVLRRHLPPFDHQVEAINCHHNYVARETHFGEQVWLTRKGAVDASKGRMGIIPGSMGAKSFIVEGRGNPEAFNSCSHGAGRRMSRTRAKEAISLADHVAATQGVECRKDEGVLDESPAAYKDIDAVMAAQTDLVEIRYTLRQVLCVKG
ncbi:MAG: RtcB family protein [Reyranella sp.]|jgi:tRNA-splicing ligase RtcB|uniref:RtcB family protein n=1 Tax=Reyranella sp. TaxID=1929291 RepID=UPI0025DAFC14|nr:RtcB family protein [Reyranella sp.]MBR2816493.1 RtcB family protein [Reyranella sp.]